MHGTLQKTDLSSFSTPELRNCMEYEVADSSSGGQGVTTPRQTLAAQIDIAANMEGEYSINV